LTDCSSPKDKGGFADTYDTDAQSLRADVFDGPLSSDGTNSIPGDRTAALKFSQIIHCFD
jgi:hypothetical protein